MISSPGMWCESSCCFEWKCFFGWFVLSEIQHRCSIKKNKILSNCYEIRGIESSFCCRYLYLVAFYRAPRRQAEANTLWRSRHGSPSGLNFATRLVLCSSPLGQMWCWVLGEEPCPLRPCLLPLAGSVQSRFQEFLVIHKPAVTCAESLQACSRLCWILAEGCWSGWNHRRRKFRLLTKC